MQNKDYFYIAIIGILAIVIMVNRCTEKPKPEKHYVYETEIKYSDEPFKKIEDRLKGLENKIKETPPTNITYYPSPNTETTIIEKIPDSLLVYISELEKQITISDNYIKQFPQADKLIDFTLGIDSLNLSLLGIGGNLRQESYPLYLTKYNYYWKDNKLYHKDREKQTTLTKKSNTWNQLYLTGGYEFLYKKPTIGLDYSVKIGRFRLSAEMDLYWVTRPEYLGSLKVGYRLLN